MFEDIKFPLADMQNWGKDISDALAPLNLTSELNSLTSTINFNQEVGTARLCGNA